MLRGYHPVGRQQSKGAATGALAHHDRQRRSLQHHHVGETAGDLTGQPALLSLDRERRARGVDDRHQGEVELVGQMHAASRLAQRPRAQRAEERLTSPVLSEQDARRPAEPRQREQQSRIGLALSGAVERDDVGRGVPQQPPHAWPSGIAGARHRVPSVADTDWFVARVLLVGRRLARRHHDLQRAVHDLGQCLRR